MRKIKNLIRKIYWLLIRVIPFTRCIYETRNTQTPISFRYWFYQKVLGKSKKYSYIYYVIKREIIMRAKNPNKS